MAEKTIPKPTLEAQRAQSLGGPDFRLVFDREQEKWVVKRVEDISPSAITYQKWSDGQKTYTLVPGKFDGPRKGNVVPFEFRPFAETNPLATRIRDKNLQIVTDPQNGRTYLGDGKSEFYVYFGSDNAVTIEPDYDIVKKAALDDLRTSGKLQELFDELYKRKQISKATYNSKSTTANDFNASLAGLIGEYSKAVVDFNTTGVGQEPPNFLQYSKGLFVGFGEGKEGPIPSRTFQDIGKNELNAFIDQIYIETIGRKPTEEQRASKLTELNKIVKKGVLTTQKKVGGEMQTRTTGGFDQQREALKLRGGIEEENPLEFERRQAFDFMGELQKIMQGGM
jgi:hypothetical protein